MPKAIAADMILKTSHVAKKFGITPFQLRRVLRSMTEYADGVHTNYRWNGWKDPMIAKIEKQIKQIETRNADAAKIAKAKLAKAEPQPQKKVAKPRTKKAKVEVTAPAQELQAPAASVEETPAQ